MSEPVLTPTGPGPVEIVENASSDKTVSEYTVRITTPGVYYFTAEASLNPSTLYSDRLAIIVYDHNQLDAMLKAKWNGMKQALASNDIPRALNYYSSDTSQLYSSIFTALQGGLPSLAQGMNEIELVESDGFTAKYRIRKNETYGGQPYEVTYYIHFARDTDGLWKIYRY